MKQRILHTMRQYVKVGMIVIAATLSACSHTEKRYAFATPQGAVSVCRQELAKIETMEKASLEELTTVTANWLELQDSTYSIFMRNATVQTDRKTASEFFAIADSFRTKIAELAFSEKRTMGDVLKLRVVIDKGRKHEMEQRDQLSVRVVCDKMIQNAVKCRAGIHAKKELSKQESAKYRWQLIQPFVAFDENTTVALTDEQIKTLTEIADELPRLLAYVDGIDYDNSPKEQTEKLAKVLSEYFLKSYLSSVL